MQLFSLCFRTHLRAAPGAAERKSDRESEKGERRECEAKRVAPFGLVLRACPVAGRCRSLPAPIDGHKFLNRNYSYMRRGVAQGEREREGIGEKCIMKAIRIKK